MVRTVFSRYTVPCYFFYYFQNLTTTFLVLDLILIEYVNFYTHTILRYILYQYWSEYERYSGECSIVDFSRDSDRAACRNTLESLFFMYYCYLVQTIMYFRDMFFIILSAHDAMTPVRRVAMYIFALIISDSDYVMIVFFYDLS